MCSLYTLFDAILVIWRSMDNCKKVTMELKCREHVAEVVAFLRFVMLPMLYRDKPGEPRRKLIRSAAPGVTSPTIFLSTFTVTFSISPHSSNLTSQDTRDHNPHKLPPHSPGRFYKAKKYQSQALILRTVIAIYLICLHDNNRCTTALNPLLFLFLQ